MTAFTYGYNVNGLVAFRSSRLIKNKQTYVNEVDECFHLAQSNELLPRRDLSCLNRVLKPIPMDYQATPETLRI